MPGNENPEVIPGFSESDLPMAEEPDPESLPTHVRTSGPKFRGLSREEQRDLGMMFLFDEAKRKEVQASVDHGAVKKLTKGTLNPEQIMRPRWIVTWKNPLPGSTEFRAKARLVILGFEDPGIGNKIDTNAPTLSKDGRQLLLQQVSSNSWPLINFHVSTAFLRGKGDGHLLSSSQPFR